MTPVRIALPAHLRNLAGVEGEVQVEVDGPATISDALDALEASYPMLAGTIRDHESGERRDFLRYFTCGEDISHHRPDTPLPEPVVRGERVFRVVGAIAGG